MNSPPANFSPSKYAVWVLLAIFAALCGAGLSRTSAIFDEGNHLTRGLYPLSGNGFLLNKEHPPLINLLQALPVHIALKPRMFPATPEMYPFFFHSEAVLWHSGNDGKQMLLISRCVTLALSLALGGLLFLWGRELYGDAGGLTSLCLFAFSPMMLAHGGLTTTDMGLALCLFACFYALWRLLGNPTRGRLIAAGLCLGAAIGGKHSALMLLPVSLAIFLWAGAMGLTDFANALRGKKGYSAEPAPQTFAIRLSNLVLVWLALAGTAFLVLWALYGFSVGRVGGSAMVVPAPDYFEGLSQGWRYLREGRVYYLNGEVSDKGWIAYFPLAFVYKTPMAFLVMLILTLGLHLRGKINVGKNMGPVAAGIAVIALAVVFKKTNLGLRYLLWVLPFLFLYAGVVTRFPRWRVIVLPLLAWLAVDTLSNHPHYLAYFNQTISTQEKRLHLVDSNLDWGQSLPALAEYQRERKIDMIRLGYFGTADPKAYGIKAEPLPSFMQTGWNSDIAELQTDGRLPRESVIAVSATLLQGLYVRPPDFYAPLRKIPPTAELGGGAMLIYDFRNHRR